MDLAAAVRQVILERKTEKVLGDPVAPVVYSSAQLAEGDQIVKRAIQVSGWAPFHYDRRADGLAEPWRVWWMDNASCQRLANALPDLIPDMKSGNKMPGLLSGCGSLTLFTCLPQLSEDDHDNQKLERINREHLAATAAAVQNFLLLLTAHGIRNYWASGTLIADYLYSTLGIPQDHMLTAAVFAHYPNAIGHTDMVGGKQRERRAADARWLQEICFPG